MSLPCFPFSIQDRNTDRQGAAHRPTPTMDMDDTRTQQVEVWPRTYQKHKFSILLDPLSEDLFPQVRRGRVKVSDEVHSRI